MGTDTDTHTHKILVFFYPGRNSNGKTLGLDGRQKGNEDLLKNKNNGASISSPIICLTPSIPNTFQPCLTTATKECSLIINCRKALQRLTTGMLEVQ